MAKGMLNMKTTKTGTTIVGLTYKVREIEIEIMAVYWIFINCTLHITLYHIIHTIHTIYPSSLSRTVLFWVLILELLRDQSSLTRIAKRFTTSHPTFTAVELVPQQTPNSPPTWSVPSWNCIHWHRDGRRELSRPWPCSNNTFFRYQGHVGAALILGGVDCTGAHLYTIYPHGIHWPSPTLQWVQGPWMPWQSSKLPTVQTWKRTKPSLL